MKKLILLLVFVTAQVQAEVFTLLIYEPQKSYALRTDEKSSYWLDFGSFAGGMQKAGILRGGTAFVAGSGARTVDVKKGASEVKTGSLDGAKEILSGYLAIDVKDIDEAVAWAQKAPKQYGLRIDVRPSQPNPQMSKN